MITGRQYDIRDLFRIVFGHVALPYPHSEEDPSLPDPQATFKAVTGSQKRVRGLKLGVPHFMPCSIEGQILDIEPLISLEGAQRIIRTEINGGKRKGTVKELWAMDDWRIRIQGFVEAETNDYPSDEVQDIRKFFEAGRTLSIDCELLRIHGIQHIVIERVRYPEMQGIQSMQAFELACFSDDYPERELELNNPAN